MRERIDYPVSASLTAPLQRYPVPLRLATLLATVFPVVLLIIWT